MLMDLRNGSPVGFWPVETKFFRPIFIFFSAQNVPTKYMRSLQLGSHVTRSLLSSVRQLYRVDSFIHVCNILHINFHDL